ncbi:MAG: hypothetical protein IPH05_03610 [Flavobacteriales bacterium]|nr:hypothetical protein [Flavobacteriales bacterium]
MAEAQSNNAPEVPIADRPNFCLLIDTINSTEMLINLPLGRFHAFGRAMVEQMTEHWTGLSMDGQALKYGGDGWMAFGEEKEQIEKLCCLALVMAKSYQEDMVKRTGLSVDQVPAIRIAICSAVDARVTLPNGHLDFISDSARRVSRCAGLCYPNEILTDHTVPYYGNRDFVFHKMSVEERELRPKPKREEEVIELWILNGLSDGVATWDAKPTHFAYTYARIKSEKETITAAKEIAAELGAQEPLTPAAEAPSLNLLHALMSGSPSGGNRKCHYGDGAQHCSLG